MNPFLFEEFLRSRNEAMARRLEHSSRVQVAREVRSGRRLGAFVSAFVRFCRRHSPIAQTAGLGSARPADDCLEALTPALGADGPAGFDGDEIAADCA